MVNDDLQRERERLADIALELSALRGEQTSRAALAAESRLSRARIEMLFPDEEDLFDAAVERWFAPEIALMDEVVASTLPPQRKMYEFFVRRFQRRRGEYRRDPGMYTALCELGGARYERIRGFVDLADHYLCEIIAESQAEGYFPGLDIDSARSLINQLVIAYTLPDLIAVLDEKLGEDKLAAIVDTIFLGLRAGNGAAAAGRVALRSA